jgi:signal transduction histidine kinase
MNAAILHEATEVGGVITDPEPVDFHRLGLAGCIDRLTAPLRRQGTCVHWETPHHGVEISASCATLLYKSAQAALSNTFKHAHATDVTVRLSSVFHGIRLTVADNGTGFGSQSGSHSGNHSAQKDALAPATTDGGHPGLGTISAAVEEAGGTVAIDSDPGSGTAVTITIPLD